MKFSIDFSIFIAEPKAFGNATGSIELPVVPSVGDKILFTMAKNDLPFPFFGFDGSATVEERILFANDVKTPPLILLSNFVVSGKADADSLAEYLEKGFGLFVNIYDENEFPVNLQ